MYLFERIIGISTYLITLLIFYVLISNNKITVKRGLKIYLIIISIMAFFYIPPPGEDLTRIIEMIKSFNDYKFENFLPVLSSSGYPLGMLFYYVIGKFKIYGLIPAITVLITYKNIFYIIEESAKKYKLSHKNIGWLLVFIMSVGMYGYIITNIRTLLAFSILCRCLYNEFIKNRKVYKNFLLYMVALLIHPASALIIICRVVYYVFIQSNIKIEKKLFFIICATIFYIVLKGFFMNSFNKFINYFYNNEYFWIYEFVKILILDLYLLYAFCLCRKIIVINRLEKKEEMSLCNFSIILLVVILMLREFNILMRVSYFSAILFIPISAFIQQNVQLLKHRKRYMYITFFVTMLLFTISCTRGHLSSYKFFL